MLQYSATHTANRLETMFNIVISAAEDIESNVTGKWY